MRKARMGLKDWIAPFITLLIGASTIFISYKNYQAQAAAKPSELARLELWSKLLNEAGMEISTLPPTDELTSDQRVVLENYRVFLKRASLESKLRKVGIDSNRIFSLLMKRAHSSVKPTPIQMGDSISYYRLILRALLYIWVPLAVVFIGVPIIVVTIAYLVGLFTNHRGEWSASRPGCGRRGRPHLPAEPRHLGHYREQRVLLLLGHLRLQEELPRLGPRLQRAPGG